MIGAFVAVQAICKESEATSHLDRSHTSKLLYEGEKNIGRDRRSRIVRRWKWRSFAGLLRVAYFVEQMVSVAMR